MAKHYEEHERILRELTEVARRKGQITTATLREQLGIVQGTAEAQVMHNLIISLKKAGILKPSDAGRKRNQFLHVVPEKRSELEARYERARVNSGKGPSSNGSNRNSTAPRTPQVVTALTHRVEDLEGRLSDLDGEGQFSNLKGLVPLAGELALVPDKLDRLGEDVALLAKDVAQLVDMWS